MSKDIPRNTTNAYMPGVPLPAGAIHVQPFEVRHDGRCLRLFKGIRRGTDDVSVEMVGYQEYTGPVVRRAIYVDAERLDNELDAATARQLARHLIGAADELDALTEAEEAKR